MTSALIELQVDGLPGPTHHFGGLSHGNLASLSHAGFRAHPKLAALQSLEKMRQVVRLGGQQAWLPPLLRPDLALLRQSGFHGSDAEVLAAAQDHPHLLNIATSSAFMWSANCATIIPETDSADGHCHIIPANLLAMSHRAREGHGRAKQWRHIAASVPQVVIHDPLPSISVLSDEGAANHSRLFSDGNVTHLFVYGRTTENAPTTRFPARQTLAACQAVARCGGLTTDNSLFIQQSPTAIDAGAFHNDVVMVSSDNHLLIHENAWVDQPQLLASLRQRHPSLHIAEISQKDLSLPDAVASYLFNSQLLALPYGLVMIAPQQAASGPARTVINKLCDNGFLSAVHFLDLNESMANGGGPACLRLRVPISQAILSQLPNGFLLTEEKVDALGNIVRQHYRDSLVASDLADVALLQECLAAHQAFAACI